jgi:hypothetical protein
VCEVPISSDSRGSPWIPWCEPTRGVRNCSPFCEQVWANVCSAECVKLAGWARANGVHPQTAYRRFGEDRMLVPARRLASGTIWVDAPEADDAGRTVTCARVSCHDQRTDLGRQHRTATRLVKLLLRSSGTAWRRRR